MKVLLLLGGIIIGTATPKAASNGIDHHENISLELFAKEPMVVDPVAISFAANGDAFVVEMRDYPYGIDGKGKPGGTIRLLRDLDGDGVADESHVFADGLSFPTSVMAWRSGILVTAPPQILYLEDTNNDLKADLIKVILDGFKLGVTDSNLNSLRWGIDGRVHGANGGAGGRVFSPLQPNLEKIKLGSFDFSFDPDSGHWERTAHTGGGFGLVFDQAGHSFTTYNINYLQQRIIRSPYLDNNQSLRKFEATVNISKHGESARIFPISEAQTRVNHPEQAGHFSAAGGMGIIETGPFSIALGKSIFVCDVVGNLIHRDLLTEDGPIFKGSRAPEEQTKEFIASRDASFRPIGLEFGPDGAIYLIDMQREVIEHPDYIPNKVLQGMNVRGGENRGRIYRITPRGQELKRKSLPNKADKNQLIKMLNSSNVWLAETAHRLLHEKGHNPKSAKNVRELWLSCSQKVDWNLIGESLISNSPAMRENALILSEADGTPKHILDRIVSMTAEDPHPRVRFQAVLSLGEKSHPQKLSSLAKYLLCDAKYYWSRKATWTSIAGNSHKLLSLLVNEPKFTASDFDEHRGILLKELTELAAREAKENINFYVWLKTLNLNAIPPSDQVSLLEGLRSSWSEEPPSKNMHQHAKDCLDRLDNLEIATPVLIALYRLINQTLPQNLEKAWLSAVKQISNPNLSIERRKTLVTILGETSNTEAQNALLELLESNVTSSLQESAIEALRKNRPDKLGQKILKRWRSISPSFRPQLIRLLLRKSNDRVSLLDSLDAKEVTVQELNLDLEQRRTLLRWSSPSISKRAKAYFGDHEYSNRKAVVEDWLVKLPKKGDHTTGESVYQRACALCHRMANLGKKVGPDLTNISHRSVEDLLSHIIDPNMAINPNYVSCVIETLDNTIQSGLLSEENEHTVSLTLPGGLQKQIQRKSIKRIEVLPTSLMPEGMELAITPFEMRSLIDFLQQR